MRVCECDLHRVLLVHVQAYIDETMTWTTHSRKVIPRRTRASISDVQLRLFSVHVSFPFLQALIRAVGTPSFQPPVADPPSRYRFFFCAFRTLRQIICLGNSRSLVLYGTSFIDLYDLGIAVEPWWRAPTVFCIYTTVSSPSKVGNYE